MSTADTHIAIKNYIQYLVKCAAKRVEQRNANTDQYLPFLYIQCTKAEKQITMIELYKYILKQLSGQISNEHTITFTVTFDGQGSRGWREEKGERLLLMWRLTWLAK